MSGEARKIPMQPLDEMVSHWAALGLIDPEWAHVARWVAPPKPPT